VAGKLGDAQAKLKYFGLKKKQDNRVEGTTFEEFVEMAY
jgi:hypothetical protein